MKRCLILLLQLTISLSVLAQQEDVGVCIITGDSVFGVSYAKRFPMFSVMKFPQALFVANELASRGVGMNEKVTVKRADLIQDTWSPMLKGMAEEDSFSYSELLALSLQQSDNNACDILFQQFGSPSKVERFIRKLGFKNIHIRKTERQMNDHPLSSNENWCTPLDMARLFNWFYVHREDNEPLRFIWHLMRECKTGQERLPAAFPEGASIIHKTGTGYPTSSGPSAICDAGIVILPDGSYQAVTVFVKFPTSGARISEIVRKLLNK